MHYKDPLLEDRVPVVESFLIACHSWHTIVAQLPRSAIMLSGVGLSIPPKASG